MEIYFEGGYAEQEYGRPNSLAPQSRAPAIPTNHPGLIEDARRRGTRPVSLVSVVRLEGGTRQLTGSSYRPVDTFQRRDGDTLRGVIGADWDFNIGDREWNMNAAFSWSEQSSTQWRQTDTRADELTQALQGFGGPNCNPFTGVAGEGKFNYQTAGNFDDGSCYFYNPFGNAHFATDGTYVDGAVNPTSLTVDAGVDYDGDGVSDPVALFNPPELIAWLEGGSLEIDEAEQRVIDVVFAGDLFDMTHGPVGMAVGLQYRHDDLTKDFDVNFRRKNAAFRFGADPVRAQLTTAAAFVEVNVPVLATLDLQAAVRYEQFRDLDADTTDPKLSLIWRPNDEWSFRASWGQSFRVGGLIQLFGTQSTVSNTADPYLDTEFFLPWISTGNPGLEPEESEAWNIGLSWNGQEGSWVEGFSVNLDYWNYEYENLLTKESAPLLLQMDGIARLGPDGLLGTPDDCFDASCGANPEQVIRNSTLNPVRILPNFTNANSVEVSGADAEISYEWSNDWGLFSVGAATAWTEKYEADTGGTVIDAVGSLNRRTIVARALPEFKTNISFNWTKDRHSVFVLARFIDDVVNDAPVSGFISGTRQLALCYLATGTVCTDIPSDTADRKLDSTWWTDIYYNFQLPKMGFVPEGSTISVGVRNAFDTEPEVVDNNAGFDGIMHDARGRMWMVRYRASLM